MKLNNLFLIGSLAITSAIANDFQSQFNYFGNITGSTLNKDGYSVRGYKTDEVQNNFQLNTYSKMGAQATLYNDNFMFVVQGLAHREDGKIENELTWLNGKYNITSNLSVRVGRMQLATFLNADTLNIDYTQLWAKAPNFVYNMMPLRSYDGIDLNYERVVGDYYLNIQATPSGKYDTTLDSLQADLNLKLTDIRNIAISVSNNNFEVKGTLTKVRMDMPVNNPEFDQLLATLTSFGNDMSDYDYLNVDVTVATLGLDYNYENYLVAVEVATIDMNSLYPDMLTYYARLGYRYNKYTPFVMYAENINDEDHFNTDNIVDPGIAAYGIASGTTKAGLEVALYQNNSSQRTISIGTRYDIKPGLALKVQIDRTSISNFGAIYDSYDRLGFLAKDAGVASKAVYQYTMGLNFAF